MNELQAQLFESWFEDALISGTQWFECPLSSPQGDRLYQCRFVDIYTGPTEDGPGQWMFQAELELFERPILRGGWGLYAPEYFAQFGLIDEAMNQEWPAA
ncbi:hypothetical protein [Stutzerimonas stutzeri]|nr:hypothetical protein [Stutzerimonas stutzeri]